MKVWKRIAAAALAAVLAASLVSCSRDNVDTKQSDSAEEITGQVAGQIEGSMGRYVEQDLTFPEGEVYFYNILSDGTIRMMCSSGIYDSMDQGESWALWNGQPEELKKLLGEEVNMGNFKRKAINRAAIGSDGSIFYCRLKGAEKYSYYYMDKDGSIREVKVTQEDGETPIELFYMELYGSGDLIAYDDMGRVLRIDCSNGQIKHTFLEAEGETSEIVSPVVVGDRLFLFHMIQNYEEDGTMNIKNISVDTYSLENNEKLEKPKALEDFLNENFKENDEATLTAYISGRDGNNLYFVNTKGIYRFAVDGSVVERIFNGGQGQMNIDTCFGGIALDQDQLILSYSETEHVKYVFDPDIPSTPEKEITVYSLEDNYELRMAITKYQKANPDTFVNYEVGLTDTDAVTKDDAIKVLNTNIMAGEGPDVLLLEGMPIDAYMEKGLLADITDVVNEVSGEDGLFDNIAHTYQREDKILAVPNRFTIPVILGKKETLNQLTDLDSLVKMAGEQKDGTTQGISIMDQMDTFFLLKILLPSSSPAWVKEDGTLDGEALSQFLTNAEQLADIYQIPEERRSGIEMDEGSTFELAQFMTTGECYLAQMVRENSDLNPFNMKDRQNLFVMTSAIKQLGEQEYDYSAAPGQASGVYIPMMATGINAKSTEIEASKEFISFLLRPDSGLRSGWSVNQKEFEQIQEKTENVQEGIRNIIADEMEGTTMEFNFIWPSKADFDKWKAMAESLNTSAVTDDMINLTVLEEGAKCLKGECSVEEAVNNITSKLNLYLSE